jgi:hypothetical protein
MQKISSYLYSNRIAINLDLASSPVEWRIVYQRKVKIYKGYDNIISLDIKNSDQKRIDVSALTLKCLIMDHLGQEVYTADVIHSDTPGLASFTIPSLAVDSITPQFLRYAVYVLNDDDTRNVIYGDTQYGVTGFMDLIGDATITGIPPKIITTFNYLDDTAVNDLRYYYSDAVVVKIPNENVSTTNVDLAFATNQLDADITVQVSKSGVVSNPTVWTNVETFTVTNSTTTVSKSYEIDTDIVWLRVRYKLNQTNPAGKIDKITITQ